MMEWKIGKVYEVEAFFPQVSTRLVEKLCHPLIPFRKAAVKREAKAFEVIGGDC